LKQGKNQNQDPGFLFSVHLVTGHDLIYASSTMVFFKIFFPDYP